MSGTTPGPLSCFSALLAVSEVEGSERLPELCYPREDCMSLPGKFKNGDPEPSLERSRILFEVQDYVSKCLGQAEACFLRESGFYRDGIDERDGCSSPKKLRARERILEIIDRITFKEENLEAFSGEIIKIASEAGLVAAFSNHLNPCHRPHISSVLVYNSLGTTMTCTPEKILMIGRDKFPSEEFGGVEELLTAAFVSGQTKNDVFSLNGILMSLAEWNLQTSQSIPFQRSLKYAFNTTDFKEAVLRMVDDGPYQYGGSYRRGDSRCAFFLTGALALGTQGLRRQEVIAIELLCQLKMIVTDSLRILRGMRSTGRNGEAVLYSEKFRACYLKSFHSGESLYRASVLTNAREIEKSVKLPAVINAIISEYFQECIEPLAGLVCGMDFAFLKRKRIDEMKSRYEDQVNTGCPGLDGLPLIQMVLPAQYG